MGEIKSSIKVYICANGTAPLDEVPFLSLFLENWERLEDELYVVHNYFNDFLSKVVDKGLREIIERSEYMGFSGTIGTTIISMYMFDNRINYKFVRTDQQGVEQEISFLTSGDTVCIKSFEITLSAYTAIMEDVLNNWPSEPEQQAALFREN